MRIKNCACMYTKYSKYNSNFTRSSVFKITYQSICQILSCRFCLTGKKMDIMLVICYYFLFQLYKYSQISVPRTRIGRIPRWLELIWKSRQFSLYIKKKKPLLEQIPQTVELVNNKITSFTMPNSNITIYLTDVRYSWMYLQQSVINVRLPTDNCLLNDYR
jgi:hypothetical protein